jgi:hypothetical protein
MKNMQNENYKKFPDKETFNKIYNFILFYKQAMMLQNKNIWYRFYNNPNKEAKLLHRKKYGPEHYFEGSAILYPGYTFYFFQIKYITFILQLLCKINVKLLQKYPYDYRC